MTKICIFDFCKIVLKSCKFVLIAGGFIVNPRVLCYNYLNRNTVLYCGGTTMDIIKTTKNQKAMHAIYIGTLCSVAYLAVYFVRNILGVVTPQMIKNGYSEAYIGKVSSLYFVFYAFGQLINGLIGDKVKARNMIVIGLFMAGVTNLIFAAVSGTNAQAAMIAYGLSGFFLSMIYGPMTKVVAENTELVYATRCSLGYTFASFIASPLAGTVAAVMVWQNAFLTGSISLGVMAAVCFIFFMLFEKKGMIKYGQYRSIKRKHGNIKILIEHQILKFTLISIITGVVRTTVVFWMPTYISQYLEFSPEASAITFTIATFMISFSTFISIFLYERLKKNMDLTLLILFISASTFFAFVYFIKHPYVNIALLVLSIMSSNGAATMLFSRYCPSLRDTGMVSTATGFLDCVGYIAAAVSSTVFANAVTVIGWGNLILVWFGLMVAGVVVALPYKNKVGFTKD